MTMDNESLILIPFDAEIIKAAIERNEILSRKLNVIDEDDWSEFGISALLVKAKFDITKSKIG